MVTVLALGVCTVVCALSAPAYLQIPAFEDCVSSERYESYERVCLPAKKPTQCTNKSWRALNALQGRQALERCKRKSKQNDSRADSPTSALSHEAPVSPK
jgi:hypothetical protein